MQPCAQRFCATANGKGQAQKNHLSHVYSTPCTPRDKAESTRNVSSALAVCTGEGRSERRLALGQVMEAHQLNGSSLDIINGTCRKAGKQEVL